jgi:hypothetical protein
MSEAQKKQAFDAVIRATQKSTPQTSSPRNRSNQSSAKPQENITESPCSNPLKFAQERFRPTYPPYPAHLLYGARTVLQFNGNKNQICRFRVVADKPIEGMDIKPLGYSVSGSGHVRDCELSCQLGEKKEVEIRILATAPITFVCIDSIK